MTDNNNQEDSTSSGEIQAMSNPLRSINTDKHTFVTSGKEVIFDLDDCTVYEIYLDCQDDGCTQKSSKFVAVGNLPRNPEEAISITHQIYDWFYENHQNIPIWSEDPAPFVATFVVVPTDCIHPSNIGPRFSLLVAAALGFLDAREGRVKKERMETADLAVNLAEMVLAAAPNRDLGILLKGMSDSFR